MNSKCLRHSMNRIQSKDHRIGTYNSKKIICLVLMRKNIYSQNKVYDKLAEDVIILF